MKYFPSKTKHLFNINNELFFVLIFYYFEHSEIYELKNGSKIRIRRS